MTEWKLGISRRSGLSFWKTSSEAIRAAARGRLSAIVRQNIDALVARFYENFLRDEEASAFLSHTVVHERLSHSLRKWLLDLIEADPHAGLDAFDARQIKIGEIHARLKIPNHLVMEGMGLLKTEISFKVADLGLEAQATAHTLILLDEIIDYAMRLMSMAYVTDTKLRVQTDEAFRLFSLGRDVNLERETQRATLMEWSQSVLFSLLGHGSASAPGSLAGSPFGLWVRHRAAVHFQGSPILASIEELIGAIDGEALNSLDSSQPASVAEFQRRIDEIKFLLNDLFQAAASLENGRDPLTRALNRRFLPSVLGREITLAKKADTPLSVLMIDIDHFKAINDNHGHAVGDIVLRHIAELLLNTVRDSDFVFRYGGEEFLIVLVETDRKEASVIAERVRQQLAGHDVPVRDGEALSVTASIGVATHEGHPDYEYLIDAADKALYRAKNEGRNRVAVAAAA